MVKAKTDGVGGAQRDQDPRLRPGQPAHQLHAWKQVRVDFGIENLFDKFYYLPTGGAYTGQGTTMTNPACPTTRSGALLCRAWAARCTSVCARPAFCRIAVLRRQNTESWSTGSTACCHTVVLAARMLHGFEGRPFPAVGGSAGGPGSCFCATWVARIGVSCWVFR
jgi:hypothetical protein